MNTTSASSSVLSWTDLFFDIPVKTTASSKTPNSATSKTILSGLTGSVKSGEMIAIMGPSGAGKTTLLNALSGRISAGGRLSGDILLNGKLREESSWKKLSAFVEQEDLLFPFLTVRETINTAASLKLSSSTFTHQDKLRKADEVIQALRLTKAADTMIGSAAVRGVSGGEKKRTAIAVELVSDPEVLFLDEPTSGLDSNSSFSVLSNVKTESEKTGRIVVSTIHQPSFEVLSLFTKVILLAPGGRLIYDGSSADALTHFESLGFICPSRKNPADFFLDLLTLEDASQKEAHEQSMARVERLVVAYKKVEASRKSEASSSTLTVHKKGTEDVERLEKKKGSSVINSNHVPFANNWFQEFAILLRRAWLDLVRNKQLLIGSLAQTIIITCLIGFTFFRMATDQESIQNRIGILFFWPTNLVFTTVIPIVSVLPLKRVIMMRERVARSYRVSSFYLSITLVEMLKVVFFTTLAIVPLYFMMALQLSATKFFYWYAIQICHVLASAALGIFIGAAVKQVEIAQIVGPLSAVTFLLFGGVLINNNNLPAYFRWIQYLSPINYAYRANMINEMTGLALTCNVQPCYTQGQQILDYQDIGGIPIWLCIVAELALCIGFSTLGYIALTQTSKRKLRL